MRLFCKETNRRRKYEQKTC